MQIDSFPKGTMALSDHRWRREMEKEVETKTRCHVKGFVSIFNEIFFDNTDRKETKKPDFKRVMHTYMNAYSSCKAWSLPYL